MNFKRIEYLHDPQSGKSHTLDFGCLENWIFFFTRRKPVKGWKEVSELEEIKKTTRIKITRPVMVNVNCFYQYFPDHTKLHYVLYFKYGYWNY
ncbi:hypothetical protein O9G_005223 [Rozella allomycis CSF55]|uniref:Uncharacterized protein n=1 Tax=Rozella allomycis (strain CSF55) TaxID=988480 RepID=A0A075AQT9_ROZAC|nr:hypothetical protein O9G_005223 [Rozella allomycis CSF55]|eukprot:EPZ30957.1 hypothetical protein O9G_005223 [Rozella allomycis CSF55]